MEKPSARMARGKNSLIIRMAGAAPMVIRMVITLVTSSNMVGVGHCCNTQYDGTASNSMSIRV